jgi:hypothetical protein
MKRKELYEYIREEIIGTLSEDNTALVTSKAGTKSVSFKNPAELNSLKSDSNVSNITTTSGQKIKEMANVSSKIKINDPEKFALAKEIYTAGKTRALLNAVEESGDEGMTQTELGIALNIKNDSELNPIIGSLRAAGVLTPKRDKMIKPEKPEKELTSPSTITPDEESEDETVDNFYKGDEEETPEEEPTPVSDKEVEKSVGKTYTELSPEEETLFNTYKTAIINKAKVLIDKKAPAADKAKAKAALDSYKIKDNVKKVFAKKGLKLLAFIDGELNK